MTSGGRKQHDRPSLLAVRAALPDELGAAVDAFERHLRLELNRSPHTVRAYLGDVVGLLDHLTKLGGGRLDDLDLSRLRGWLAILTNQGAARTSIARHAAALRTFTAWARRTGRIETDPGALLVSPRAHRTLPPVLDAREAAAAMTAAEHGPDTDSPLALRDRLIVEMLYATGIRVAELSGSTSTTSTGAGGWCECWARARKSGRCPTASRPNVPSRPGSAGAARNWPRRPAPPHYSWVHGGAGSIRARYAPWCTAR